MPTLVTRVADQPVDPTDRDAHPRRHGPVAPPGSPENRSLYPGRAHSANRMGYHDERQKRTSAARPAW